MKRLSVVFRLALIGVLVSGFLPAVAGEKAANDIGEVLGAV